MAQEEERPSGDWKVSVVIPTLHRRAFRGVLEQDTKSLIGPADVSSVCKCVRSLAPRVETSAGCVWKGKWDILKPFDYR